MSQVVADVLTTVLVSAILIPAIAWLTKTIITHRLSLEAEKFKSKLEEQAAKFQADVDRKLHEHSVVFTRLHEKRVEAVEKIHAALVESAAAAEVYLNPAAFNICFADIASLNVIREPLSTLRYRLLLLHCCPERIVIYKPVDVAIQRDQQRSCLNDVQHRQRPKGLSITLDSASVFFDFGNGLQELCCQPPMLGWCVVRFIRNPLMLALATFDPLIQHCHYLICLFFGDTCPLVWLSIGQYSFCRRWLRHLPSTKNLFVIFRRMSAVCCSPTCAYRLTISSVLWPRIAASSLGEAPDIAK